MTHPRKQIRDAVVTLLKAGVTAVNQRVYSNRSTPFKTESLPALNVITSDEDISKHTESTRWMKRLLTVEIEILEKDANSESLDDRCDAIAETVEAVLAANETLSDKADDCVPKASSIELRSAGDQPMGGLRLVYTATYYTQYVAAEADLDTFEVGHYVIKPSEATATTPEMSGDVALEQ